MHGETGLVARPLLDARLTTKAAANRRPVVEVSALAGASEHGIAGRFRFWRGRSGQRYVFSVYETTAIDLPRYDNAVVLSVKRGADGSQQIVHIGRTGTLPEIYLNSSAVNDAARGGVNELHIHLLTSGKRDQDALIADLNPGIEVVSSPATHLEPVPLAPSRRMM